MMRREPGRDRRSRLPESYSRATEIAVACAPPLPLETLKCFGAKDYSIVSYKCMNSLINEYLFLFLVFIFLFSNFQFFFIFRFYFYLCFSFLSLSLCFYFYFLCRPHVAYVRGPHEPFVSKDSSFSISNFIIVDYKHFQCNRDPHK